MNPALKSILKSAADKLNDTSEAEILLSEVLGLSRANLRFDDTRVMTSNELQRFDDFVNARMNNQPISQIIGHRDFWKYNFVVTPDVLDPRPDTETLIECAVNLGPFERILDLGTGSGCILISVLKEWHNATGVGVDVSKAALDVAETNALNLDVMDRITLKASNWFGNVSGKFDLIVSNPPYISEDEMHSLDADVKDWEPRIALTPEGDGLGAYRLIAEQAGAYLSKNGTVLFEIGFEQAELVSDILKENAFLNIKTHTDINGKNRVVSAIL